MQSLNELLNKVKILKILLFDESRKVGFGLWLFISANLLLWRHVITGDQWMDCVIMCSILIGGGTFSDKWLSKKKDLNATGTTTQIPQA